jgi:hypothetical protein
MALARLTGLSLDAMLAGRITQVDVCPACGAKRAKEIAAGAGGAS